MAQLSNEERTQINDLLFKQLESAEVKSAAFFLLRDKIVKCNLPLAYKIAHKYINKNTQRYYDDIMSVAEMGLVKALNAFKLAKACKFATFASVCIQNEILMFLRKEKKYMVKMVSLDSPLNNDEDDDYTLSDVMGDNGEWEEKMHSEVERKEQICLLQDVLKFLNEKELTVFKMYSNSEGRMTQMEIARRLNLSQSYVSRIIKNSIKVLGAAVQGELKYYPNGKRCKITNIEDAKKLSLQEKQENDESVIISIAGEEVE